MAASVAPAVPAAPPNNPVEAARLGLPWWNAPVPFVGVGGAPGQSRKIIPSDTQKDDLIFTLRKMVKSGGNTRPAKKEYIANSHIAIVLNAYNARDPATLQEPWVYFHSHITTIPRDPPAGFNWNQRAYRLRMPRGEPYRDNFERDLTREWPTIAANGPARAQRWTIHYRLLCFIHEHEDPQDVDNFYDKTYSMTVYDRETEELAWHNPSRYNRAERLGDINAFWANHVDDFPIIFPPTVVPVEYGSLETLSGFIHWTLDPVFTQRSIFSIGIWLMNNSTIAPVTPGQGPRPPDTIQTVSGGGDTSLLPALIQCLWQSLHESAVAEDDYFGNGPVAQEWVRRNFGMADGENRWLRTAVNRRLRQLYPIGSGAQEWIPAKFLNRN